MDKDIFYLEIGKSLFSGRLSSAQQDGIEVKIEAFDRHGIEDERWRAYMLATSYHETAFTMQPVEEIGKGKGKPYGEKRKYDGTPYSYPDKLYFGRGDVQLTWYENYKKIGRLLGIPLLACPELALDPDISASIMIEGMTQGVSTRGDFTGVSLENYFNDQKEDPVNARRIVNGLDRAQLIVGYYKKFLAALRIAMVVLLLIVAGCKPQQVVTERVVTRTDSTAVRVLKDSLMKKEKQIAFLRTDLKRASEENIHIKSDSHRHEIHYDTSAPPDSVTGKQPVASEIITHIRSRYEKVAGDEETRRDEWSGERESRVLEQKSEVSAVDRQTDEDRLKEKKVSSRRNHTLFLAGVMVGLVIEILLLCFGSRLGLFRRRKVL